MLAIASAFGESPSEHVVLIVEHALIVINTALLVVAHRRHKDP